ncbi:MAG: sensor histidine kinase [Myxococcales bacterium FL481]|nr:MAG: sensor histidine kinase [Myxococcales bacterium FL481]
MRSPPSTGRIAVVPRAFSVVAAQRRVEDIEWLVRLRWGAIAGQLALIAGVSYGLGVTLPLVELGVVVIAEVGFNLMFTWMRRRGVRFGSRAVAGMMAGDICAFTAILYFTGGPFNPFSFLYLVYVALAAVAVGAPWSWGLAALAFAGFGALFLDHRSLDLPHHHGGADLHGGSAMDLHMKGMWVALCVASAFIVHFIRRVLAQLQQREAQLAAIREQTHRTEKLASLATLAAGAAHELSSPLSTIAIAAKELQRGLKAESAPLGRPMPRLPGRSWAQRRGGRPRHRTSGHDRAPPRGARRSRSHEPRDSALLDDTELIRAEVERCREILEVMAVKAGSPRADGMERVTLGRLIDRVRHAGHDFSRVVVEVDPDQARAMVTVPPRTVQYALSAIVRNAIEADPTASEVTLTGTAHRDQVEMVVTDRGPGMPAAQRDRASEPFFTTKAQGMGMGLFLAETVATRLGGKLEIESTPGCGTTVRFVLPRG